jgi:hypothetical protein
MRVNTPLGQFAFTSADVRFSWQGHTGLDAKFLENVVAVATQKDELWRSDRAGGLKSLTLSNQCPMLSLVAGKVENELATLRLIPRQRGSACTLKVGSANTPRFPHELKAGDHLIITFRTTAAVTPLLGVLKPEELSAKLARPLPGAAVGSESPVSADTLSLAGSPLEVRAVTAVIDQRELLLTSAIRHAGFHSAFVDGQDATTRNWLLAMVTILSGLIALLGVPKEVLAWFGHSQPQPRGDSKSS